MKRSENINVNSLWQKLTNKVKSDYSTAYKPKLTQNQPPTTGRYNGQIIRAPPPNGMYQQPHINNPRRVPHDIYLPPINNPRRHSQNSYDPPSTSSTEQQEEAEKRRKFWLARIERMNKVLCEFNLQHLAGNFERDDVSVEDVEYLSDGDFIQLGIIRRGDKCRLKRRCIKLTQGMSDKFVFHGEDNYDDLVEEHYKEEEIRPVTATTHKAPTAQATQIVPNDLSSSSSEMQVEMASESRFEMGDKNNVVKTKQIITADYIGTVGQAIGTEETKEHDIERPTSGKVMSENKMTVKMEEHAVFEAGNKNNFIENQLEVTASEINTVGGNLGPSGAGLPGIPGLGGNNIHIALGENAAFNLSNMDNIDIKEKEEPEYFVVNFVDQSKRKPGRLKTKRLREAFKNEFGFFIFQKLLRIYEQLLVEKERPVRIKPKVEREKILDQETWNVKIYDQMMEDTNNELSNLVTEHSEQLSAEEQNIEIVETELSEQLSAEEQNIEIVETEHSEQLSAEEQNIEIVEDTLNNNREDSEVAIEELEKDKPEESLPKSPERSSKSPTGKKLAYNLEYHKDESNGTVTTCINIQEKKEDRKVKKIPNIFKINTTLGAPKNRGAEKRKISKPSSHEIWR